MKTQQNKAIPEMPRHNDCVFFALVIDARGDMSSLARSVQRLPLILDANKQGKPYSITFGCRKHEGDGLRMEFYATEKETVAALEELKKQVDGKNELHVHGNFTSLAKGLPGWNDLTESDKREKAQRMAMH